jgi:hypothetical protein
MFAKTLGSDTAPATSQVSIEWHDAWSPAIDEAFTAMPYDYLMDPEVVRRLWVHLERKSRQRIAIARNAGGQPVGIVPLVQREFHGRFSWQLLTQYVQPYARYFVLPGYTDATLAAMRAHIACSNVLFYELPRAGVHLQPEESWVVTLDGSYQELMKRTKYAHQDRRIRRHAAIFDVFEDRYEDLPVALSHWEEHWRRRGSLETATRKDEMLVSYQTMAEQGRLKTFSLYVGSRFAGMNVMLVAGDTIFDLMATALDEFRSDYPGVYTMLLMLEWACNNGLGQADMLRTSGELKGNWAAPEARGYRLVRGPMGSVRAALAREWVWRNYGRVSRRLTRLSQRHFPSPAPNPAPGQSSSLREAAG